VEVGDEVEAGQLIAVVEDGGPRAQRELARAEVLAARSAQRETEVRLAEARNAHGRSARLVVVGVLSRAAEQGAQAEVNAQQARLEHQRDVVRVALRRVDYWNHEVERRQVRAPFDGVVVSRDAEVGEFVAPVEEASRFARVGLVTLVDMESLEVEVDINESLLGRVEPGQRASVTPDAFPDAVIPARVAALVPAADRRRATVRIRIAFEAQDPRVWPEMGVRVQIATAAESGAQR
jgi:RND family efflux transporter MFP subunit